MTDEELSEFQLVYCGSSARSCKTWHSGEHLGRSREEYWEDRRRERKAEQESSRNNQHVISVTITVVT